MNNRLPKINNTTKILIICEGYEEYDYLSKLKSCKVWDNQFDIQIKNAKSIDNIAPTYQYDYANGNYKIIFIVCDTEIAPYSQFLSLIKSLNDFHGNKSAKNVVFFANPCTMQIILSHFSKVTLNSNNKTINSSTINKLTGIVDYKATKNQRISLMNKIDAVNYKSMETNISSLSQDYQNIPSSNMIILFNNLDKFNFGWIEKTNKSLDK